MIAGTKYITYHGNSSSSARHHIEFGKYRQFDDRAWDHRQNKRELYAQHKQVLLRIERMQGLTLQKVFDGIEQMKQGHAPGSTNKMEIAASNTPLEIPIPSMSDEEISVMIAQIEPNSFDAIDAITGFGRAVNQGVMEQLQINDQTAAEIAYADEDSVLVSLDRARDSLNRTFSALSTQLTGDMKGQRELALEINDETTKHLSDTKPKVS